MIKKHLCIVCSKYMEKIHEKEAMKALKCCRNANCTPKASPDLLILV